MVDSAKFNRSGDRVLDANGNAVSGARIKFWNAGTTTPKTVYQDKGLTVAHSWPVVTDSGGSIPDIYFGTADFKYRIYNSDDTTITGEVEHDNQPGALNTSSFLTSSVAQTPVISKSSNYTITSADRGKMINADPTSASFTLTLPDAATVGDGWEVSVRHTGTANQVIMATVSGQTVSGYTGYVLGRFGHSITLVSDGANLSIKQGSETGGMGRVTYSAKDRDLLTPPGSPAAGDIYLLPPTGTLLGGWSTFTNGNLVIYMGAGGWQVLKSVIGDEVYLIDEVIFLTYTDTCFLHLARGAINTVSIAQNASDPSRDIDISAGMVLDDTNTYVIKIKSTLTKQLDASWAFGNNAGGLSSGSIASATWYHIFAVLNPSNGAVDVIFSTSYSSPTLPSGYTKKRYLGSIKTDGSSNIIGFVHAGGWFHWKSPTLDINTTIGTSASSQALNLPTGFYCEVNLAFFVGSSANNLVYIRSADSAFTDLAPGDTTAPLSEVTTDPNSRDIGRGLYTTDSNGQLSCRASAASTTLRMSVRAWRPIV